MLYRVSLSKAGAKLRTFSQTPTFTRLFLTFPESFFRKTLENRYVTRHIFFVIHRRRRKTYTIIFIARAGACARRKIHRIIRKKRHGARTTPCLHQNNGIFSPKIHLLFLKLQHIFFRVMKRLIISNDGNTQSGTVSSSKNIPFMSDEYAKKQRIPSL